MTSLRLKDCIDMLFDIGYMADAKAIQAIYGGDITRIEDYLQSLLRRGKITKADNGFVKSKKVVISQANS